MRVSLRTYRCNTLVPREPVVRICHRIIPAQGIVEKRRMRWRWSIWRHRDLMSYDEVGPCSQLMREIDLSLLNLLEGIRPVEHPNHPRLGMMIVRLLYLRVTNAWNAPEKMRDRSQLVRRNCDYRLNPFEGGKSRTTFRGSALEWSEEV